MEGLGTCWGFGPKQWRVAVATPRSRGVAASEGTLILHYPYQGSLNNYSTITVPQGSEHSLL